MDKIVKFIDCYVPTEACNFKCAYCYIPTLQNFANKTRKLNYDPEHIGKALTKERLGGVCIFNLCAGGETLLSNDVVPITEELVKNGHYVMIVTNGSISKKFDEIIKIPKKYHDQIFIKFSYHFLELKKLNLMDKFFDNVKKMKDAGISYTIELTPGDVYIPYIDEIKKTCLEKAGALPHVTVARVENEEIPIMTELSREEYIKTWSQFDSPMFDFKIKVFGEKRKEFCYAGKWSYILDLGTGDLRQCYRGRVLQNIFKDISSPIKEEPIGYCCPEPHCFNSHAFLAYGDIPELETPTFAEQRNRISEIDGSEWLCPKMKQIMSQRLYDNNTQLTENEKIKATKNNIKKNRTEKNIKRIKQVIKKAIKNGK